MAVEDFNKARVLELAKLMDPNAWDEDALRLLRATGALDIYRRRDRSYAQAGEVWASLDKLMISCGVHVSNLTDEIRAQQITIA